MSDEDAVSEEVETAFDLGSYAEVRITVLLPGSLTSDGEPKKFGYSQLMLPEEVRMANPEVTLPYLIQRAARGLMVGMSFR